MEKWIVLSLMAAFVITFIAIWIPLLRKADADLRGVEKTPGRDGGGVGLALSGGSDCGGGGAGGGDGGAC